MCKFARHLSRHRSAHLPMQDSRCWKYAKHALQVREEASAYWWLRAALAPLTLLNMALSGILQVCAPTLPHSFFWQETWANPPVQGLASI